MNVIYFDACAFVLLIMMFISNWLRGLTKGRTNYLFMILMIIAAIATVADFMSGYGSNYYSQSENHKKLLYIYNFLYFFSHNNVCLVYFLYCFSSMGIWHVIKKNKFVNVVYCISFIIYNLLLITNPFNHYLFYIDESIDYKRGDGILICYIITVIIAVISTIILWKYRNVVKKDKFIVLFSMVPVYMIAMIIQAIYENLLIEMYVLAVEIAVFILVVQRQDEVIEPTSGAKGYNAGVDKLKLIMTMQTPVSIILIKVLNYNNIKMYVGQSKYNSLLKEISNNLNSISQYLKLNSELYYLNYGLFAILTEDIYKEKVFLTAVKAKNLMSTKFNCENMTVSTDARICIVNCPDDISDYSTLVTFGTSFHSSVNETKDILYYRDFALASEFIIKNRIEEIIKRALNENKFEMYYQPIYSVKKKKFVAAEALIRLNDEEFGNISTPLFIKASEKIGYIHEIGDLVLNKVCDFISNNNISLYGIDNIHINLSPYQCIEADMVDKVRRRLREKNISPDKISFEITEAAADLDPKLVESNIMELHDYGVKFILDDYGIGYSNIKRLISLPIDLIKLDKQFVSNLNNDYNRVIINDTIKMFKAIDKEVLVIGIESEETAKYFKEQGCDYIQGCEFLQGFLFCKPLPEKEFIKFLAKQ